MQSIPLQISRRLVYIYAMAKRSQSQGKPKLYPLISPEQRLAVWEKARGMWKHRRPDPIRELKEIRGTWSHRVARPD